MFRVYCLVFQLILLWKYSNHEIVGYENKKRTVYASRRPENFDSMDSDSLRLLTRTTTATGFILIYLALVPQHIHLLSELMRFKDYEYSSVDSDGTNDVYDFIIVGAGAAGSVVANQLSKNKQNRVLLLERGGDPNSYTSIPYFYEEYKNSPDTAHRYQSVPQTNSYGSTGGIVPIPQGIGLGGSTNVNNMHFLRGSPSVYNEWAKITGDSDWSFTSVLPFFKKIENYRGPIGPNNAKYRSRKGPMYVAPESFHPSRSYLFSALKEKGYRQTDVNAGGPKAKQYDALQRNTKKGRRQGAYQSFLKPILHTRKNLKILRYAQVQKIHLNAKNKAKGVWYKRHGKRRYVRARKEIIISAGALESPKLLMLSGIGPKDHLDELQIPSHTNLPVGKNLFDHTGISIKAVFNETNISFVPDRDFTYSSITDYFKYGKGPLRSPDGVFAMIFQSSRSAAKLAPEIQIIVGTGRLRPMGEANTKSYHSDYESKDHNDITILNTQPKSSGTLQLKSKDPNDDPIIDQKFYSDPSDFDIIIEGINHVIDIYETTEDYKKLDATVKPSFMTKECNKLEFRSRAYWECYIRNSDAYGAHPSGACAMGSGKNDPNAVLDSKLRVIGTKNLRVIDSSIFPRIPNVNTMVPTLMVGERGSNFITRHWNKRSLTKKR